MIKSRWTKQKSNVVIFCIYQFFHWKYIDCFNFTLSHCRLLHQKSIRNSIYYQNKSMSNFCRAFSSLCSALKSYLFVPIFTASNKDIGRLLILTYICAYKTSNKPLFYQNNSSRGLNSNCFGTNPMQTDLCRVTAIHKQDFIIIFILGTIRYAINKLRILIP